MIPLIVRCASLNIGKLDLFGGTRRTYQIEEIPPMDPRLHLSLFYQMLRIRRIEQAIYLCYKEQKMRCPIHLSIGQEAIAVGVCSHLKEEDVVFSTHRSHAHYLAKGGNLRKMIAELHGKQTGCTQGRGGSMHLIDLDVGFQGSSPLAAGSIPLAAGFSFAYRMKQLPSLCCSFFGEGAAQEGVFAETLRFASLQSLPLLFVCENNCDTPLTPTHAEQSPTKIAQAHNIFALSSYANRIEKVYATAKKGIDYIRKEKKPAFIECKTYRLCENIISRYSQIDHPFDQGDIAWQSHCPITSCQKHLLESKVLSPSELEEMKKKIDLEVEDSFAFAQESGFPVFDLDDERPYAE